MYKNNTLNKLCIRKEIFEYYLRYSKRNSLEIKIKADGQIYVSAPFYMNIKDIEEVLNKKYDWMISKRQFLSEQNRDNKNEFSDMNIIPFKGQDISFDINENNKKRVSFRFDGKKLELDIPSGFQSNDREILVKENLRKFYKNYTQDYLKDKLEYYKNMIDVKFVNYRIKDQKSRWGSCSTKGNLNFNFRLSMLPEFVFDYVIVHELCHIREMNHSQRFWMLVERYCPEYKEAREWLRKNSQRLMFI